MLTTLGHAEIALLCAATAGLWLFLAQDRQRVWAWFLPLSVVTLLTLASKVAFIGWGYGSATLDFTGLSGHAVLSAAIYPVLFRILAINAAPPIQRLSIWLGFALAAGIAASRVVLGMHSPSECLLGFALGSSVSGLALRLPWGNHQPVPKWLQVALAAWLLAMLLLAPSSRTHGLTVRLALYLSQHSRPYTRADLHPKPNTPILTCPGPHASPP